MDTKINLCDNCLRCLSFPQCMPDSDEGVEFGDAKGHDNIIRCSNFLMIHGGNDETEDN